MRRALVMGLVVASCAQPFTEPDVLGRELPGQGDPPRRTLPKYEADAGPLELPDSGCCPVRFAHPASGEAGAELFGFSGPFVPAIALVRDGGVWETLVCMPRARVQYAYRLFLTPDVDPDAGFFELVSHNPNAPTLASRQYGLLNEFEGSDAGSCADLDARPHGDTTVADAGPLSVPFDAGEPADGG